MCCLWAGGRTLSWECISSVAVYWRLFLASASPSFSLLYSLLLFVTWDTAFCRADRFWYCSLIWVPVVPSCKIIGSFLDTPQSSEIVTELPSRLICFFCICWSAMMLLTSVYRSSFTVPLNLGGSSERLYTYSSFTSRVVTLFGYSLSSWAIDSPCFRSFEMVDSFERLSSCYS